MSQANLDYAYLYAYIEGAWTLLDDCQPWRFSWGISGNRPTDRIADTGELRFTLNNNDGLYTPGGPDELTGWKKGIPVKLVMSFEGEEYIRFRGVISDIDIKPNSKDKKAYVTVLDWLDYAARHPIVNPGIQTDKRGDEVLGTVIDLIDIHPLATDFDTGRETFATVFDTTTSKTKAYSEFAKVAFSELGYVYLKKDRDYGETLRFESADARHGWREVDATPITSGFALLMENNSYLLLEDGGKILLNETTVSSLSDERLNDFEAVYGENVINRFTATANPRRLDASPVALFGLDEEIVIASGSTYVLKGSFSDPNGGSPVNGQDMIAPVVTTDYTMFTETGGGGSNISGSLTVNITYGTEGFTAELTNGNASTGYLNFFQTRGTGIYMYNQIEHAATHAGSIAKFGTESENINQKYKNDLYAVSAWVESQVDEHNQPRTVLNSISFTANRSSTNMLLFLNSDVGDLRNVSINEINVNGNYYIQGVSVEMNNKIIHVTWIVALALSIQTPSGGLEAVTVEFNSSGTTDYVDFGSQPRLSNSEETISMWIYPTSNPAISKVITLFDGTTLGITTTNLKAYWYQVTTSVFGVWTTPTNSITLNAWNHIVFMRNITSDTLADPVIYINGTSQTITEVTAPIGTTISDYGPLLIGNAYSATFPFYGRVFDFRYYNRTLSSAEITTLYNSGTPSEFLVTDGLVFQAFAVRASDAGSYIDTTLTSDMTVRDNIFGAVGVPNGSPVGRSNP